MPLSRRDMLKRSTAAVGVLAVGNVHSLFSGSPAAAALHGVGPLVPDPDGLLSLPDGFRYTVLSRQGAPLEHGTVPGRFDGGAAFRGPGRTTYYVRNHEQSASATDPARAAADLTYDPGAVGGTTTLVIEDGDRVVDEYVSLAGTVKNCAGGTTPWGTWLTCEETFEDAGGPYEHKHGYVFEVDPAGPGRNRDPEPLVGMGRFQHEAVAVDPRDGEVYLTEDDSGPLGMLLRFIPARRPHGFGDYRAGGQLLAMRCFDGGDVVTDLSPYQQIGTRLRVEWVPVPDPDGGTAGEIRRQFDHVGVTGTPGGPITRARKLEGMWWSTSSQTASFVSSYARLTDGSLAQHDGQVWSLDPKAGQIRLELVLEYSADRQAERPNGPDNITVTPWGGLLLAEDHDGDKHLYAADKRGRIAPFARNEVSGGEMAGVCFSPDGRVLYTSIYDPGITFAITGPFQQLR